MEKIKISETTLYLPPSMSGEKLKRFLDMNGFTFNSKKVIRLHSNSVKKRVHSAILKKEIDEYFSDSKSDNELPYIIRK
jgi:hypothetical protein